MSRRRAQADLISLFERFVRAEIDIPYELAKAVLPLLKRVPFEGRGRGPRSGRTLVRDSLVVWWARERKAELMEDGMSAENAEYEAADEASKRDTRPNKLSLEAIRDRLQHPRRFRVS